MGSRCSLRAFFARVTRGTTKEHMIRATVRIISPTQTRMLIETMNKDSALKQDYAVVDGGAS